MDDIRFEVDGRRTYVLGNTFPIKDQIKYAGGKWDPDKQAWWVGNAKAAGFKESLEGAKPKEEDDPERLKAKARVEYKEKRYYQLVTSRDGKKQKLCSADCKLQFWASSDECRVIKSYGRANYRTGDFEYPTIATLRRYAEQRKKEDKGEAECPVCAKYCTCGKSFCHHHHDGCDRCGAEN